MVDALLEYDFEQDEKLSERRKEACRKNYEEMTLEDLDHLFTSSYKYEKQTKKPLYKKPRSLYELVWLSMQRNYDLLARITELENRLLAMENK